MIRNATLADAEQLAAIYNYYITNSYATFEEVEVDAANFESRIKKVTSKYPWLVYEKDNTILGYAYAGDFNTRCAYKYTAETSVYLKHDHLGNGVGSKLYMELLKILKANKFRAIIGGVSLPNEASVRLHEKLGFKKVAHYKDVGFKFGNWIDVAYWQLIYK